MKDAENYYTDSAQEPASHGGNPEEPGYGEEQPHDEMKEHEGDETMFEAPKSALAGKTFKPGDEVMFEIVRMGEDSVVLRYATEKPGEGGEGGEAEGGGEPMPAGEPGGSNPGSNYY